MRFQCNILFLCAALVVSASLFSQSKQIDSLKNALRTSSADTTRCYILSRLVQVAPDSEWESYNDEMMRFSEKKLEELGNDRPSALVYKRYLASSYNNRGYALQDKGESNKALPFFEKSLQLRREINDQRGIAQTINNIGAIYHTQGNIQKAIEYYHSGLSAREKMGDLPGVALGLSNLGNIYIGQRDFPKAQEYLEKSLAIARKLNEKSQIANCLNSLGVVYRNKQEPEKAMASYREAYEQYSKINNKHGMAISLNNIGVILDNQNKYQDALLHYQQSLELREQTQDKTGIAICLVNIGRAYGKLKRYNEGVRQLEKALEIGKKHSHAEAVKTAAQELYVLYKDKKDAKNALNYFELFITMHDSINNENTRKASIRSQLKYEYEKQAAADSVAHAKETEIKNAELKKQEAEIRAKKNQQYALFGGLALVMVFAGFMYNRFKVTQKQKAIIEEQKTEVEKQKKLVEEKQKEIIDSIHYAKRIQLTLIPGEKQVNNALRRSKQS